MANLKAERICTSRFCPPPGPVRPETHRWPPPDYPPSSAWRCSIYSRSRHLQTHRHPHLHTRSHICHPGPVSCWCSLTLGGSGGGRTYSSSPDSCMKSSSSDMVESLKIKRGKEGLEDSWLEFGGIRDESAVAVRGNGLPKTVRF